MIMFLFLLSIFSSDLHYADNAGLHSIHRLLTICRNSKLVIQLMSHLSLSKTIRSIRSTSDTVQPHSLSRTRSTVAGTAYKIISHTHIMFIACINLFQFRSCHHIIHCGMQALESVRFFPYNLCFCKMRTFKLKSVFLYRTSISN